MIQHEGQRIRHKGGINEPALSFNHFPYCYSDFCHSTNLKCSDIYSQRMHTDFIHPRDNIYANAVAFFGRRLHFVLVILHRSAFFFILLKRFRKIMYTPTPYYTVLYIYSSLKMYYMKCVASDADDACFMCLKAFIFP